MITLKGDIDVNILQAQFFYMTSSIKLTKRQNKLSEKEKGYKHFAYTEYDNA
jgi:hypothetical protein